MESQLNRAFAKTFMPQLAISQANRDHDESAASSFRVTGSILTQSSP